MRAEGLTSAQVKAYRIADNRTHEEAEWDDELLAIELGELQESGFALDLTGSDEDELDKLLAESSPGKNATGAYSPWSYRRPLSTRP